MTKPKMAERQAKRFALKVRLVHSLLQSIHCETGRHYNTKDKSLYYLGKALDKVKLAVDHFDQKTDNLGDQFRRREDAEKIEELVDQIEASLLTSSKFDKCLI